jgi:phosphoglycolate phosphatase
VAPAAIVFDLDGTLVDSRPDLTSAVNRMRAGLALPPLPDLAVEAMIGEGARLLVERALAGAPAQISRTAALADFLAHYGAACTVSTHPHPGIEALLARCHRRWPLALLTNKPGAMTDALVGHLGWGSCFRHVVAGDSLGFRKPDRRGLDHLAAAFGVSVDRLLLVGDSRIDAETARAAGAGFVWVEWGYAAAADRPGLAGGSSARTPEALGAYFDALAP